MNDDAELDELLQSEGVAADGVDALLEWARGRAAQLVADTAGDPELGPLLREGGEVGEDRRAPGRRRGKRGEAEEARESAGVLRDREAEIESDRSATRRGRGDKKSGKRGRKRKTGETAAAAEPAAEASAEPSAAIEASAEESAEAASEQSAESSQWREPMPGDHEARHDEEITTPRGEASSAGPLPAIPRSRAAASEEIDEIEELDAEELEMIEDEPQSDEAAPPSEPSAEAAPPEPAADRPTFGPPDGTDEVPAWKAALFAAETGSDAEAAKLIIKEGESGVRPLPAPPEPVLGERLEAEEDEISQHKIDLSDLDGDPDAS